MGLSDSGILLSENDLNAMEFSFLLRSTFPRDHDHDRYLIETSGEEEEDDNINRRRPEGQQQQIVVQDDKDESKLSQSSSSSGEEGRVEDDDNGFKTPTSLEHKIPTILRCPLAPRKPKSRPITKRKASRRQQLLLDLSYEIQSLFPPDFLVELGGKIKRV